MGMAASQARFLGLTARKNNVEYEGQQVNQQRTTLSNQSASYYNDLLGMSVPTPPSVDNYTKTVYTFQDGALSNSLTSLIPQNDGNYNISYLRQYSDDFAIVSAASNVVTKSDSDYYVGSSKLRELGQISTTTKVGCSIAVDGKTYAVSEENGSYYINKETGNMTESTALCSANDIKNIEYYYYDPSNPDTITPYYKQSDGSFAYKDNNGKLVKDSKTEDDMIMSLRDNSQTNPEYSILFVTKNAGKYVKQAYSPETEKTKLTDAQVQSISYAVSASDDPALKDLSAEELTQLKNEELEYIKLLEKEIGTGPWLVRYVKDSSTGASVPYFYRQKDLENVIYDEKNQSQSSVKCYTVGSKERSEEVKNVENVKIEKDSTGRLININIPDGNGGYTTYALTTNTLTDQAAYDDAMNQYEYNKYQYDQSIENINSKIAIVQSQDKNLELRLKQLDTEQKAISTEIDSVSKVIEKNTESSFKTFG